MTLEEQADASEAIVQAIRPLLAGNDPAVQGSVFADLTAIWLAGHIVLGDTAATDQLRRDVFGSHCRAIWQLVELYDGGDRTQTGG